MKKLLLLLVSVFTLQTAMADNDKPIAFTQLPQAAQTFVKKYFPQEEVALSTKDTGFLDVSYDVAFLSGNKVEFDKNGNWKEVRHTTAVPQGIVPTPISTYITKNFPGAKVIKIEKDRYEYEVKLSNRWELKFDTKFNLIDIDNDD